MELAERKLVLMLGVALALLAFRSSANANSAHTQFTYAGGTENLQFHCEGDLDVGGTSMIFRCPAGSITIPFDSITHMEYRPKLSSSVRKMKLDWTAKPFASGGKKNRFFTVVYRKDRHMHAVVLKVSPNDMRPYLAVLELHTGKRIEVWDYRGFD